MIVFFDYLADNILRKYWFSQENKEGLELLKTAIAKAGYTDKVGSLLSYN